MKKDKELALPQSASSDGLESGRQPTSKVPTRERLAEIRSEANGSYVSPSDHEYDVKELLAFIEDHLLPIVRGVVQSKSDRDQALQRLRAQRILDEGGY